MTDPHQAGGAGGAGGQQAGGERVLERRYRRLLWCYPAGYRRARSSELLDTLVEVAAPGQRWPAAREARALVLGGLRARTGADRVRTRGDVWLGAIRLAVLFLLAHAAALALADTGHLLSGLVIDGRSLYASALGYTELGYPLVLVLAAAALVAVAAGRPVVALPLTVVAVPVQQWSVSWLHPGPTPGSYLMFSWEGLLFAQSCQLALAALLTVPLLFRRPAAPGRPWRWLLAVPVGVFVLPTSFEVSFPSDQLFAVLVLGAAVWCVVDARVPIAAGALLLGYAGTDLFQLGLALYGPLYAGDSVSLPALPLSVPPVTAWAVLEVTVVVVLVAAGAVRARRQAVP
jgi:hypothetical protein